MACPVFVDKHETVLAVVADDRVSRRLHPFLEQFLSTFRFRLPVLWLVALGRCMLLAELDLVLGGFWRGLLLGVELTIRVLTLH